MINVPFSKIPESLKKELEEIVSSDSYGLKAETLYNNIASSIGNNFELAEIFNVPFSLVTQIKMLNKKG